MTCYVCHLSKYVRAIGVWFSRSGTKFVRCRCDNPACAFKYESVADVGQVKNGQPTWKVHAAEVQN